MKTRIGITLLTLMLLSGAIAANPRVTRSSTAFTIVDAALLIGSTNVLELLDSLTAGDVTGWAANPALSDIDADGNNITNAAVVTASSVTVDDDAYDATGWNGSTNVPTKNALRDKIEALGTGVDHTGQVDFEETGSITNVLNAEIIGDLLLGSTNVAGAIAGKQPLDTDLTRLGGIGEGTAGDVYFRDATGWTNLAAGTDGQVLKLASGLPSWAADSTSTLDPTGIIDGEDTGTVTNMLHGEFETLVVVSNTVTELNVTTLNVTDAIDGVNLTNVPNLEVTTGLIIPANSIALATDTTGNYVATIADSGASEITVANSGSENAAVTLAIAAGIARDSEVAANTNLLHLNVGTLSVTNQLKTSWQQVTLDDTNAVIDLKLGPNFYWSTTTSNYLTFSNITAGAQGSILIYTPDSGGEEINFTNTINNLSTNRYAPVFVSTNQTWIGYQVTFGTDETNVTVGISVK